MVAPDDMRTMEPDKLRRVQSLLKGTDRLMQQIGACADEEAHVIAFRFDPIDLGNRDSHQFGLVRHPEFFGPLRLMQSRARIVRARRSEEHTSTPVTNAHLVCRLLLEKKNIKIMQSLAH